MFRNLRPSTLVVLCLALLMGAVAAVGGTSPPAQGTQIVTEDIGVELALLGIDGFDFVQRTHNCDLQCLSNVNCRIHLQWPPVPGKWCANGCSCQPCDGQWGCYEN